MLNVVSSTFFSSCCFCPSSANELTSQILTKAVSVLFEYLNYSSDLLDIEATEFASYLLNLHLFPLRLGNRFAFLDDRGPLSCSALASGGLQMSLHRPRRARSSRSSRALDQAAIWRGFILNCQCRFRGFYSLVDARDVTHELSLGFVENFEFVAWLSSFLLFAFFLLHICVF